MYIKAFKINEVNINVKLLFTKSEAIALCKKGKHKVRKVMLQHLAEKLMEIPDISNVVGDDHIKYAKKEQINIPTKEELLGTTNESSNS